MSPENELEKPFCNYTLSLGAVVVCMILAGFFSSEEGKVNIDSREGRAGML